METDALEGWRAHLDEQFGSPDDVTVESGRELETRAGPLELRTPRALVDRPRASITALAVSSGLSHRVARRTRAPLVGTDAVSLELLLRPSRGGRLFHHVMIIMQDPDEPTHQPG